MVIERSFEVVTVVPPDVVLDILSDMELNIPMWSIYESMEPISDNEAYVTLRISGSTYRLRMRLRRERNRVVIEGRGPITMNMVITVERRGAGTIISGKVTVKAGFFRERILAPGIAAFIDDTKNKVMFQLPMIAEVYKERRKPAAKPAPTPATGGRPAPAARPARTTPSPAPKPAPAPTPKPAATPAPSRQQAVTAGGSPPKPSGRTPATPSKASAPQRVSRPQPKAVEATRQPAKPAPAQARREVKPKPAPPAKAPAAGIEVAEDPSKLADEVTLGMILLKSELVDAGRIEANGDEIMRVVAKKYSEVGGGTVYINLRSSDRKVNVKFLIKDSKIIGVRVDTDGETVNGKEALAKILGLRGFKGHIYVFKVPEGVVA